MTADHVKSRVPTAGEVFSPAVLSLNGQSTNAKLNPERDKILSSNFHGRMRRVMGQMTPPKYGDAGTRQGVVETMRRMRICMGVIDPLIRCSKTGGYAGLPYCKEHAYDALATLRNHALEEQANERHEARQREARERENRKDNRSEEHWLAERNLIPITSETPGVVYYLLVGKLIKIGFTRDLRDRLKAYPPDTEVLAVHPGTLDVEKQMHKKFAHLLSKGREWFEDHEAIRAHIGNVVQEYGEPKLSRKKPAPQGPGIARRIR